MRTFRNGITRSDGKSSVRQVWYSRHTPCVPVPLWKARQGKEGECQCVYNGEFYHKNPKVMALHKCLLTATVLSLLALLHLVSRSKKKAIEAIRFSYLLQMRWLWEEMRQEVCPLWLGTDDAGPGGAGPCFHLGMGTLSEHTVPVTDCDHKKTSSAVCLSDANLRLFKIITISWAQWQPSLSHPK